MKKNDNEKDEQETYKRRPYSGGGLWDDLTSWAKRINALGRMLEVVSWHKNQDGGGATYPIESFGEQIGEIIRDYAELIYDNVSESYKQYVDIEEHIVFPLDYHQECIEMLTAGAFSVEGTIQQADQHIKALDAFSENVAQPAMKLRQKFADLKKLAINRNEKTSDTVTAVAEA